MNNFISSEDYKICDSHIHLADSILHKVELIDDPNYMCLSCAHSLEEYKIQHEIIESNSSVIYSSYGCHPQNPDMENVHFLEKLLREGEIDAVGEVGFDFYTDQYKQNASLQEEVFSAQLALCKEYFKPVIIHSRKATEKLFQYAEKLSKLKAVIFHSFMGTASEAQSLLNHGINCYFSFGKQLLNGNKKAVECVEKLDIERILLETDGPYQTLKGEENTSPHDIYKIYQKAMEIRNIKTQDSEEVKLFTEKIKSNFLACLIDNEPHIQCRCRFQQIH